MPVIAALDLPAREAEEVAKALAGEVAGFKVGWDAVLDAGLDAVRRVARYGPTMLDVKVGDVTHIALRVVEKAVEAGACCVVVHGFLGPSLSELTARFGDRIYVVLDMTQPTLYRLVRGYVERYVRGVRGVVVPGNAPMLVRLVRARLGCIRIASPGIGAQGGEPRRAIEAGADFEIVGRFLLEDPSRVSLWRGASPRCASEP